MRPIKTTLNPLKDSRYKNDIELKIKYVLDQLLSIAEENSCYIPEYTKVADMYADIWTPEDGTNTIQVRLDDKLLTELKNASKDFIEAVPSDILDLMNIKFGYSNLAVVREKSPAKKINELFTLIDETWTKPENSTVTKEEKKEPKKVENKEPKKPENKDSNINTEKTITKVIKETSEDETTLYNILKTRDINTQKRDYDINREIILYKDCDVVINDNFILRSDFDICPWAILQSDNKFSGYFDIINKNGHNYLTAFKENIDFNAIENASSHRLVIFDLKDKEAIQSGHKTQISGYTKDIKITVEKIKEMNSILCIDFGTSNTSVGTFVSEAATPEENIQLVPFENVLKGDEVVNILPTVVFIDSCENKKLKCKFGYEAQKYVADKNYFFKGSLFFEIKKWLLDIDKTEHVYGEDGSIADIPRKEILKEYLNYILRSTVNHFKCHFKRLHFSTPVRNKDIYINALKTILPDYEIIPSKFSIDEGVSVAYKVIADKIKDLKTTSEVFDEKQVRTVILDIGGGTTDVVSYTYSLEKSRTTINLNLNIFPENCESNFGGNNITDRIFQYLKIKIGKYYKEQSTRNEINKLITLSSEEMLVQIDSEKSTDSIYKTLNESYAKVSEYFPTDYSFNETYKTQNDKDLIKHNFYLLWNLAEAIKKEFFQQTNIYTIPLYAKDSDKAKEKLPMNGILNNISFAIAEDGQLKLRNEKPQIELALEEIRTLIYADIYNLLRKILSDIYNNIPQVYNTIILSGQTCKISLVYELLKEFIAGRKLRNSDFKKSENSNSKKINCIKGQILYTGHLMRGTITPKLKYNSAAIKHSVKIDNIEEIPFLDSKHVNIYPVPMFTMITDMKIYDCDGNFIKHEKYNYSSEENTTPITSEEIKKKFSQIYAEQIDEQLRDITEDTKFIIPIPIKSGTGFEIQEFLKDEAGIKYCSSATFSFENNIDDSQILKGDK